MVFLVYSFLGLLISSCETGLALCQVIPTRSVSDIEAFWIDAVSMDGTAGAGD